MTWVDYLFYQHVVNRGLPIGSCYLIFVLEQSYGVYPPHPPKVGIILIPLKV